VRYAGLAAAILLAATAASSTTIHVPGDQPTIQAGIDAAAAGDTVLVACGIYYEHNLVIGQPITLSSDMGDPDCVTIDGQSLARLLTCDASVPPTLEGLTFTRGVDTAVAVHGSGAIFRRCKWVSNTGTRGGALRGGLSLVEDCDFEANSATMWGGAIYGADVVRGCSFVSNEASDGGAIYESYIDVAQSTFHENHATGWGGALITWDGSIDGCLFSGNTATNGGAIVAATIDPPPVRLLDCTIRGNSATGRGGGVFAEAYYSDVHVEACHFEDNQAIEGGALAAAGSGYYPVVVTAASFQSNNADRGGAVWATDNLSISESVFLYNWADDAGAVWSNGGSLSVRQSTLARNGASAESGAIRHNGTSHRLTLRRVIIAHSAGGRAVVRVGAGPSPIIACTDIFGNVGGDWKGLGAYEDNYDNFSADPLFCDPGFAAFALSADSPCLPGSHPDGADCGLIGAFGQGCGPVSIEELSWGRIKGMYRDGGR
jgi:predicted outer membrane repeat protein